jgi:hypothetical protein
MSSRTLLKYTLTPFPDLSKTLAQKTNEMADGGATTATVLASAIHVAAHELLHSYRLIRGPSVFLFSPCRPIYAERPRSLATRRRLQLQVLRTLLRTPSRLYLCNEFYELHTHLIGLLLHTLHCYRPIRSPPTFL